MLQRMNHDAAGRPLALITGASMGIGEAFADALGARGYDLVLVARSGAELERVAARVRSAHGVRAEGLIADLEDPAARVRLGNDVEARYGAVELLVNNAGYGAHGVFEALGERNLGQVRLNVEALIALTNRFAPAMLERGRGGIINVGSTASFQPVPYMAVYGATKAFVLSFSEALTEEFRGRGVHVLALCPGVTKTNFFRTAGGGDQAGRARSAAQVVATALRAYDRRASYVIDGLSNRILAFSPRLFPRGLVAKVVGSMMKR
ncbi:MAG: SDR family NAD(P)-dependent oxidoreductase [Candidatus Velthaea sp.]